ncbi:MAG: aspartate--ammonia ligase [Erysipelotrichaceae bacterium]|nr:aspartate--ammonia ligase [Erysipelotrichaceae bacterium]
MKVYIPEGYRSSLDLYDTQASIRFIKSTFEDKLTKALHLKRVSAPLFVEKSTGLNDDLDGKAQAVNFTAPNINKECVIVHSLAKWKRMALYNYSFYEGNGLYTDMNAIRKDEKLDNLHSIYVDQWDWEKVITKEERNLYYLYETVGKIHQCILETLDELKKKHPSVTTELSPELHFFNSEELIRMYPGLDAKEREREVLKQYKSVFIVGIGHILSDGKPHDDRAADYDDWNLNGDLLYYNELLDNAFEVSSMGIRVDENSLVEQLKEHNEEYKLKYPYHQMILNKTLPYTIGGGIGESRLCMLLMNKAHIGEVQSSIWDDETLEYCKERGVIIL